MESKSSLLVAVGLTLLVLAGCTGGREEVSSADVLQAQTRVQQTSNFDRVLPVVAEYRSNAIDEATPTAFLDYYIVRQSAIELLSKTVQDTTLSNDVRLAAKSELQVLDPENIVFMDNQSQPVSLNSRQQRIVDLSPIPEVSLFNLAVYDAVASPVLQRPQNFDSGFWTAQHFRALLDKKLSAVSGCGAQSSQLECAIRHFENENIPVFIHPSVQAILNASEAAPGTPETALNVPEAALGAPEAAASDTAANRNVSVLETMRAVSDQNISFLFFPNGMYIFWGKNIPEGWQEVQANSVFSLRARHLNVEAVANAIAAAGFSSAVRSVDRPSKTILLAASPRQFIYIWLAIKKLDVPSPRIRVDVEFIEVQDSFLRDVGLRIPQTIGAAFGDPVYRYYNFGDSVALPNQGVVSQIGNTGGVTLSNYLSGNVQNVVRLLVADEAFRISAKEANISASVNERPSILINSGATGQLRVGQRVPVVSRRVTPNGEVFESTVSIETGVDLTVTGRVLDPENISMSIDMTVSGFSEQTADTRSTALPTINSRRLTSDFTVQHLETLVLGGIVSERSSTNSDGLPGFSFIPFMEALGGNRRETTNEMRILILLTPRIESTRDGSDFNYLTIFGGEQNISFPPAVNGIINSYNLQVLGSSSGGGTRGSRQ